MTEDSTTTTTKNDNSGTLDSVRIVLDSGIVSYLRDGSRLSTLGAPPPSVIGGLDCTICLERLRVGDEIGLAQNPACCHVYHKECISEWLLHHKECPLCKQPYLDFPDLA